MLIICHKSRQQKISVLCAGLMVVCNHLMSTRMKHYRNHHNLYPPSSLHPPHTPPLIIFKFEPWNCWNNRSKLDSITAIEWVLGSLQFNQKKVFHQQNMYEKIHNFPFMELEFRIQKPEPKESIGALSLLVKRQNIILWCFSVIKRSQWH